MKKEIIKIIRKEPWIVYYCDIYENAYEMINDRPSFLIEKSEKEIVEIFDKVKKWLKKGQKII